jgi:hypothetical protein
LYLDLGKRFYAKGFPIQYNVIAGEIREGYRNGVGLSPGTKAQGDPHAWNGVA